MYRIPNKIMNDDKLTPTSKIVYAAIYELVKLGQGPTRVTIMSLALTTRLTEVTVMKCVKALVEAAYVEQTKDERGWSSYKIPEGGQELEDEDHIRYPHLLPTGYKVY